MQPPFKVLSRGGGHLPCFCEIKYNRKPDVWNLVVEKKTLKEPEEVNWKVWKQSISKLIWIGSSAFLRNCRWPFWCRCTIYRRRSNCQSEGGTRFQCLLWPETDESDDFGRVLLGVHEGTKRCRVIAQWGRYLEDVFPTWLVCRPRNNSSTQLEHICLTSWFLNIEDGYDVRRCSYVLSSNCSV